MDSPSRICRNGSFIEAKLNKLINTAANDKLQQGLAELIRMLTPCLKEDNTKKREVVAHLLELLSSSSQQVQLGTSERRCVAYEIACIIKSLGAASIKELSNNAQLKELLAQQPNFVNLLPDLLVASETERRTADDTVLALQQEQVQALQPKKSARRRLFQQQDSTKADEETNEQYVERLLTELSERHKQKWNFDFDNDQPMEGQIQYDAVPAQQVPNFYRTVQNFDQQPQSSSTKMLISPVRQLQQPSAEHNKNRWTPPEQQASTSMGGDIGIEKAPVLKSPSRVLRKARRNLHTPKKQTNKNKMDGQQAEEKSQDSHRKTDKILTRSVSKQFKDPQSVPDSPKRRRQSTVDGGSPSKTISIDSPIKKG